MIENDWKTSTLSADTLNELSKPSPPTVKEKFYSLVRAAMNKAWEPKQRVNTIASSVVGFGVVAMLLGILLTPSNVPPLTPEQIAAKVAWEAELADRDIQRNADADANASREQLVKDFWQADRARTEARISAELQQRGYTTGEAKEFATEYWKAANLP